MIPVLRRQVEGARLRGGRCWTAAVALAVEALLRVRPLPSTCRLLGIELGVGGSPHEHHKSCAPERTARVRREVEWVYCRLGLPDTCLRRSLTAGFRLRAYQPRLVIGVKKASTFDAHAWLLADGSVIDWAETHGQYVPMR